MLSETQLERYADVLIWGLETARTKKFKKNDIIMVRFDPIGLRLAEILYSRLLKKGFHPIFRMMPTINMEYDFFRLSNNKQLVFISPGEEELYSNIHGSIYLHAPESITHLSEIKPEKIAKPAISKKFLRDILEKREQAGEFGWTLCMLPTKALAKHSRLSMREYSNQIVKACFLSQASPVNRWKTLYRNATSIKKWLNSLPIMSLKIESPNMDLKINMGAERRFIGISGHNIPSFELFTSPDWRGAEGIYYANQPSYRNGNYVEKARIELKKGVAVKVEAEKGADFLEAQLNMDRGAKRLGEFSLTDKRFSKIDKFMANTLFDENFGGPQGNCHVAFGASYSDTYTGDQTTLTADKKKKLGFNDSALHWDLVNTEKKTVHAQLTDGKNVLIYENGKFKY